MIHKSLLLIFLLILNKMLFMVLKFLFHLSRFNQTYRIGNATFVSTCTLSMWKYLNQFSFTTKNHFVMLFQVYVCLSLFHCCLKIYFLYAYDRVKKKPITFLIGAVIICNVNLIKLRLVNLLLYDTVDKI